MIFTAENTLLIGSILLFINTVVGRAGYRLGVPTLLLFLIAETLFGSDSLDLQFHDAKDAQFIGMVVPDIILLSGGIGTKFREIRPILGPSIVLPTVGILLAALFTGLFIWWISGMSQLNIYLSIITSLLSASTMLSMDSTSVSAILRSQKMNLKHSLRPMLELENGSNNPTAYMLTTILTQFTQSSGMGVGAIVGSFAIQLIVGAAAGYVLRELVIRMLSRLSIDNQALYPILLLAFMFFTFSITDLLKGNGYLAIYIVDIMMGNSKIMHRKDIYTFVDGLTWLSQTIMFLYLGLFVNSHEVFEVTAMALLTGILMIIIGRPLSVFLCLLPLRKTTMKSRIFVFWVGLCGIVSIIFATYPIVTGVEGLNLIFDIVFLVTVVSLVTQGTTASSVAWILSLSKLLEKTGNDFGVELPEETDSDLSDMTITKSMLEEADALKDINLPKGTLVMITKCGDEFLIPNGTLRLHKGDRLLLISEKSKKEDTGSE